MSFYNFSYQNYETRRNNLYHMYMRTHLVAVYLILRVWNENHNPIAYISYIDKVKKVPANMSKENRQIIKLSTLRLPNFPTRHMYDGEVQMFDIDRVRSSRCRLLQNSYEIRKTQNKTLSGEGTTIEGLFTANTVDANWPKIEVGTAYCRPGWIDKVDVKEIAQGCGIGTVLTELCLIDPAFKYLSRLPKFVKNKSILNLQAYPVQLDHVKTYCRGLMGMLMGAESFGSRGAANAYFNAALRQGYNLLLIHDDVEKNFHYLNVQDAKRLYQNDYSRGWPGWIGNQYEKCNCKANCDEFEAWGKDWYFCKNP